MLETPEEVEAATIERVPLWNDRRHEHGPFDIIGDVHGCCDELEALLDRTWLRFEHQLERRPRLVEPTATPIPRAARRSSSAIWWTVAHASWTRVRLVRNMVHAGSALCVPGNHDMKLLQEAPRQGRADHARPGRIAGRDRRTCRKSNASRSAKELAEFLDGLVSHYVLDDGKLVVAHAGMKAEMQGRGSGKVRDFALYGETTGETDEFGLPVRYQLGGGIPGLGDGRLRPHAGPGTGLAQPHGQHRHRLRLRRQAHRPALPGEGVRLGPGAADLLRTGPAVPADGAAGRRSSTAQQAHDDVLDADDVLGKRIVSTRLRHNVTIREENATAALEVMSRFAANPKWLIYLPPTMSPCETSSEPGLLEHPAEAFAYFRSQGVPQVICEEKHMGSRAVVVVCRDEEAAGERFGVTEGEIGIVYTRTGRRFFNDAAARRRSSSTGCASALTAADFWDEFRHDVGLPRLRTDAVVGQGAGTAASPSTPPSARRRTPRCRRRRCRSRTGGSAT